MRRTIQSILTLMLLLTLFAMGSGAVRADGPAGTKPDVAPPLPTLEEEAKAPIVEASSSDESIVEDEACRTRGFEGSTPPNYILVSPLYHTAGCYSAVNLRLNYSAYARVVALINGRTVYGHWHWITGGSSAKVIGLYLAAGTQFRIHVWNVSPYNRYYRGVTQH